MLILTAFSQRDLIEQARDAGALAYLVKPFQRSELIPAIEVALGRFREMQALAEQAQTLEEQLETRKVVDRAKGQLMDGHGLTEGDAFSFIQTHGHARAAHHEGRGRAHHRRRARPRRGMSGARTPTAIARTPADPSATDRPAGPAHATEVDMPR